MKAMVLWLMLMGAVWADDLPCSFDKTLLQKELEEQYENALVDIKYLNSHKCFKVANQNIMVRVYSQKPAKTVVITSVINREKKRIEQSHLQTFNRPFKRSPEVFLSNAFTDSDDFNRTFALYVQFSTSKRYQKVLSIYKIEPDGLHPLLLNFLSWDYYEKIVKGYVWNVAYRASVNKAKSKQDQFLTFSQNFNFAYEDKGSDWSIDLEDKKFLYHDGRYIEESTSAPIFDLKQIELNTKKGLKYRKVVIDAMLLYEPVSKETIELYKKIAFNIYKKKRDTAEIIFEKIIEFEPKSTESYRYLGDLYWNKATREEGLIDDTMHPRDAYYYEMSAKRFRLKALLIHKFYIKNLIEQHKNELTPVEAFERYTTKHFRDRIAVNTKLLQDRELIKNALYYDATIFQFLDNDMKKDSEIIEVALEEDIDNFKYLPKSFKKDQAFIYKYLKKSLSILNYVDKDLFKDASFVYNLVKIESRAFQYADEKLKKDKAFITQLLDLSSDVLRYADASIRKDKAFVLAYVQRTGWIPKGADTRFELDKDIALAISKHHGHPIHKKFYSDPEVMWLLTNYHVNYIEQLAESLKNNEKFMLALAKKNSSTIRYLNKGLQKKSDFRLESLRRSPYGFRDFNATLKNDRAFVLEAVKVNGRVLQFLNKEFQDDEEIVLEAVAYKGYSGNEILGDASERLRKSKSIVLRAVMTNPAALYFANKAFKDDKELVLKLVKKDGNVLKFASDRLKKDREVVFEAVKSNGYALSYADKMWKKDRAMVTRAVKSDGGAFCYADDVFKKDLNFYYIAPEKDRGSILAEMDGSVKKKRAYLCLAMSHSYHIWEDYDDHFDDEELMLCAIKFREKPFKYVTKRLKESRDFVLKAVKINGKVLQYCDKKFKDDLEVVETAISNYGGAILWASDRLQSDKALVVKAVKQDAVALRFLDYDNPLKKDKDVLIAAMKKDGGALKQVRNSIKNSRSLALVAVKQDGLALRHVSKALQRDRELVLEAVKQNGLAIRFAGIQNREIALTAVKNNGEAMRYLYYEFKKDKEIAMEAIKQNPKAFDYVSYLLVEELGAH